MISPERQYPIHPVEQAKRLRQPYIYWHVREVHEAEMQQAIDRKSSIEWDIALDDETGLPYIGHPKPFYTEEFNLPLPTNINLESVVAMAREAPELLIVLDCKYEKALPKIAEIIQTLGVNRTLVHSFIKEWGEPYESDIHVEAHWKHEDVPLQAIRDFQKQTGAKCIGASRALSVERLQRSDLLNRMISTAGDTFESLSLFLLGPGRPPVPLGAPLPYLKKIAAAGYLPWINVDLAKDIQSFDFPYIGMTDLPERATVTPDLFQNIRKQG